MTFWGEALPYAEQAHTGTGVLTSVILAQWADETGYGGPDWSVYHNPGNVGSFDGQPVNGFATLQDGVNAYIAAINNGDYQAVKSASSWQNQCYALGNSPWASGHYETDGGPPGEDLIKIVTANNLTQYDAAPTPPPAPTPPVVIPPEDEVQFIAQSPTGTASFLYDTQAKTRKGLSQTASVTLLEAVGIKNYGATLSKTVLAEFTLEANWD